MCRVGVFAANLIEIEIRRAAFDVGSREEGDGLLTQEWIFCLQEVASAEFPLRHPVSQPVEGKLSHTKVSAGRPRVSTRELPVIALLWRHLR